MMSSQVRSTHAKIYSLTQKKSNNIALIYIRQKLWAAAGVVGVVMMVQTDAEVDRPNKIGMVCVLVGGRWEEKKLAKSGFLLEPAIFKKHKKVPYQLLSPTTLGE